MRNTLPFSDEDALLLKRASEWSGPQSDAASLTTTRLAEIAREEGQEFATAVLHDRILSVPANAEFFRRSTQESIATPNDSLIGVVPGAFYREHRDTGADGEQVLKIARDLGCEAEVIPIKSFGSLDENAEVILDWIASHPNRRIALLSLSKGGADVKRGLASPKALPAFAHVTTWVSFSGTVQGTPLVEWLRARPLRWWGVGFLLWWKGHGKQALEQLRHGPDALLTTWPALPPHLRMVHIYGIPLQRHLRHRWAPRGYERVARLGPNDGGGILLGDLLRLPGIVFPVWGADHYLSPSWDIDPLLRNVVGAAMADSFDPLQASQSATKPSTQPATRSSA